MSWHTQILADQLTLFQPGGTDYAHLITIGTPGFLDIVQLQGAPYVFERFSEAVLRSWVDVEMKCCQIFFNSGIYLSNTIK